MQKLLNRSHLFASLDRLALPKVLLITAPSGFGKTILAKQLAEWFQGQVLWQPINTWQRDWLSLAEESQRLWASSNAISQEINITASTTPSQAAQALGKELSASPTSLYILDDIQHLRGSFKAELWLQNLIETLPAQIHLVLVGQDLPLLPWSQFLARGWIWSLTTDKLFVSGEEIQSLLDIPTEDAEDIAKQTGGWIAAIRLALEALGKEVAAHKPLEHAAGKELFESLAHDFLERQSPDFQNFLLLSSLAECFDATLCREVFGLNQIDAHVNHLQRQAFFLQTEASGYRYHEMLRQCLLAYFKQMDYAAYQHWHEKLATWFVDKDQNSFAIWHYLEAGNLPSAINLADLIGKELQTMGRSEAILQILRLLGANASAVFQLRAAIILTEQNRLDESEALLGQAISIAELNGDSLNVARCQLHLAHNYHKQGLYQKALELAKKVEEAAYVDIKPWAKRAQALAYLELGDSQSAIELFNSILQSYSEEDLAQGRSSILQDLNTAYLRSGDLDTVGMLLQEILALRRQVNNPQDLALALNDLGYYYHCCSEYEDALRTFTEGLTQIESFGGWTQRLLHWSHGDVLRDLGRFEEAETAYLAALNNSKETRNAIYPAILMSMAQLRLWQKRLVDAELLLEEAKRCLTASDPIRRLLLEVMLILIDVDAKQSRAEELFGIFDSLLSRNALIKFAQALSLSAYYLLSQKIKPIQKRFIAYLELLPENLFQSLAAQIQHRPELRPLAEKSGILRIAALCTALEKLEAQMAHSLNHSHPFQAQARQIELETLGKALVRLNGTAIPDTAWTVSLAKELFFYLYCNGAKTKEEIGLVFWPEHSSHQVRSILHNTLKRLRRALPDIIAYDGLHYRISQDYAIQDDWRQFRDFVQRAKQLPPKHARSQDLFQRAERLYQGSFLPMMDDTWLEQIRTEIEADYLSTLLGLAECALARQELQEALVFYQKALDKAPYNEDILRRLMDILAQTGQQAAVQLCFDTFMQRLENDLELSPTQLTWESFYKARSRGH